jgi:hypothetical protein
MDKWGPFFFLLLPVREREREGERERETERGLFFYFYVLCSAALEVFVEQTPIRVVSGVIRKQEPNSSETSCDNLGGEIKKNDMLIFELCQRT